MTTSDISYSISSGQTAEAEGDKMNKYLTATTVAVVIIAGLLMAAVISGRHATPATAFTTSDVLSVCLRGAFITEVPECVKSGRQLIRLRQDMAHTMWLHGQVTQSMRDLQEARSDLVDWEEPDSTPQPQSGREIIHEIRGYYTY